MSFLLFVKTSVAVFPQRCRKACVNALRDAPLLPASAGGTNTAAVDVSSTAGSATLIYQVDMTGGILTISPIDITTASGLASLTIGLTAGAPVTVYGVPQADGSLKAYVLAYYTGDLPTA